MSGRGYPGRGNRWAARPSRQHRVVPPNATAPSVVVGDLNVVSITTFPPETDSTLIVDSDAVLPFPVPDQCLQSVTGRRTWIRVGFYKNSTLTLVFPNPAPEFKAAQFKRRPFCRRETPTDREAKKQYICEQFLHRGVGRDDCSRVEQDQV